MTTNGTFVRVYWNKTRRLYSIQTKQHGKGWRVIDHASRVNIENPQFVVSKKGVERIRNTGRKEVVAYVLGTWLTDGDAIDKHVTKDYDVDTFVRFNPYTDNKFMHLQMMDEWEPIEKGEHVYLFTRQNDDGVLTPRMIVQYNEDKNYDESMSLE